MNDQQMIAVIQRLYEEVYSQGKISICDELFWQTLVFEDPSLLKNKTGIQSFKESEIMYQQAFPKKKTKIEDIFAAQDKVTVRWSCHGKHDGKLQGIPATHLSFQIKGVSIYQFTQDKISHIWQFWDRLSLLEQLEAIQTHAIP